LQQFGSKLNGDAPTLRLIYMLQIQLRFYHYSGSSNSESQFQVLTFQVQVLKKPDSSPTRVQVQDSSPTTLLL